MSSKFCVYEARGLVFERDKEGNKINKVKKHYNFSNVVRNDPFLFGAIHRQNPELLGCDQLLVRTYQI